MKQILLTQRKFAIVDDADFDWLNRFKWYAHKGAGTYYAVRHSAQIAGKRFHVDMHRVILGLNRGDKCQCDHRDHNGLNNQRSNLRICTRQQNNYNQKSRQGSSKFKGVRWRKGEHKWETRIQHKKRRICLGFFNNEIEAAEAYNVAAQKLFGEFAKLNEFQEKELK